MFDVIEELGQQVKIPLSTTIIVTRAVRLVFVGFSVTLEAVRPPSAKPDRTKRQSPADDDLYIGASIRGKHDNDMFRRCACCLYDWSSRGTKSKGPEYDGV